IPHKLNQQQQQINLLLAATSMGQQNKSNNNKRKHGHDNDGVDGEDGHISKKRKI
ncbi:9531_t:CDS:2, partial [Diversispora eburnea]